MAAQPATRLTATIGLSATREAAPEYMRAIEETGARVRLLQFSVERLDEQLADVGGIVLSDGGDVEPRAYGNRSELVASVDPVRDDFEIALVRRARERKLPTFCICRGLQIANVAFGGTLVPDIGTARGADVASLHRLQHAGAAFRGLIAGHDVAIDSSSLLATLVGTSMTTGSRHHQSLDAIAPELRVVATTPDSIVEAAEARFASPFWLGVQWHPESTMEVDGGTGRAMFAAFVTAASRYIGDSP